MTSIDSILKPKSKHDLRLDIKEMKLYDFLITFRKKSLIKIWGIGFKKKVMHFFLRFGDYSGGMYSALGVQFVIGSIWNWIFPWTENWSVSIIEHLWAGSFAIAVILLPLVIPSLIIRRKVSKQEERKERERPNYYFHFQREYWL